MKTSVLFLVATLLCMSGKYLLGSDITINLVQGILAVLTIYHVLKERR